MTDGKICKEMTPLERIEDLEHKLAEAEEQNKKLYEAYREAKAENARMYDSLHNLTILIGKVEIK